MDGWIARDVRERNPGDPGKAPIWGLGSHFSLTAVRCRVLVGSKEILHHLGNSFLPANLDQNRAWRRRAEQVLVDEFVKRGQAGRIRQARSSWTNSSSDPQYTQIQNQPQIKRFLIELLRCSAGIIIVNVFERLAQKLHRIILLLFALVTFRFHFG